MKERNGHHLFDLIAPFYGWFFNKQKRHFHAILEDHTKEMGLTSFETVLDIGCGTGAFCDSLAEEGYDVTGVDVSKNMLKVAQRKTAGSPIRFVHADVLKGLPFENHSFDVVFASFVAHGMKKSERMKLYREMGRLAKNMVILHDYNANQNIFVSLIEWLEGGDYFRFIREIDAEMDACMKTLPSRWYHHHIINVKKHASLYICKKDKNLSKGEMKHENTEV